MDIKQAENLALSLMEKHELLPLWRFSFDSSVRRFGCCKYSEKKITLSKSITTLNEEIHVRNTILHEIAHALVGAECHHNKTWQKTALAIGSDGKRCYSRAVRTPQPTYVGHCFAGHIIRSYRRKNVSCGRCSKIWNPNHIIMWEKAKQ